MELNIVKKLVKPPPEEEVVITGLAGCFPESENIYQFRENLFAKIDMVTNNDKRWQKTHPDIPRRTGKINRLSKFDASFFGIHQRQVHTMNPMTRILLEQVFEAIVDAGYNPSEFRGSRTGVFVGACLSETEKTFLYQELLPQHSAITGTIHSMIATRISYAFGFEGPSQVIDTGCSSSLYALTRAYHAISTGLCERAVVAGSNLCLNLMITLQYAKLGIAALDGVSKVFDDTANGFARAEASCVIFLQKRAAARRIYSRIVHSSANCDGYKNDGILFPSTIMQKQLLKDFYLECDIDPTTIMYLEAHAAGTKIGDAEELNAAEGVFCTGRHKPLLIGSLKSNMGHAEAAASICSLIKVLVGAEVGYIPPNLHYNRPKQGIASLETGRMKVVTEKTPWPDSNGLIAINSFGFGGVNVHTLIEWNHKEKSNIGLLQHNFPTLVTVSGRNIDSVTTIIDDLNSRPLDFEFVGLLHQVFGDDIAGHNCRGYSIIERNGEIERNVKNYSGMRKPLIFAFGDMRFNGIFDQLLEIPLFGSIKTKISDSFLSHHDSKKKSDQKMMSVILQLVLVDTLKELDVIPDYTIGVDSGKIVSEFLNGKLTLEEVVLAIVTNINNQDQLNFITEKVTHCDANIIKIGNFPYEHDHIILNFEDETISITNFLKKLGQLYTVGYNPKLNKLYPSVEWPVSRGTPMISPLIKWNHSNDWHVSYFDYVENKDIQQDVQDVPTTTELMRNNCTFLRGHVLGYLYFIIESFANVLGSSMFDMKVLFENIRFYRVPDIVQDESLKLHIEIQKESGNFQVYEGVNIVTTGTISRLHDISIELIKCERSSSAYMLDQNDIYKELRLRGCFYKDEFRRLKKSNIEATYGLITWTNDWIEFLDNMFQFKILQLDTRDLLVPSRIEYLSIDLKSHIEYVKDLEEFQEVPIYAYPAVNIVTSGAIEIRGLQVNAIPKSTINDKPLLETYEFVPNETSLSLWQAICVNIQIALENSFGTKPKVVELIDEKTNLEHELLSPLILETFNNQPLIQGEVTVLSQTPLSADIIIKNEKLNTMRNCMMIIGSEILNRNKILQDALIALKETGFILSRERYDYIVPELSEFNILTVITTPQEKLILIRQKIVEHLFSVNLSICNQNWVPVLKQAVKTSATLIVYSQYEPHSGTLGFTTCIRKEPGGENVRGVVIFDDAPKFDIENEFYKQQLEKSLAFNVFKNGQWGTYRHLVMEPFKTVDCDYAYVNNTLQWNQGPTISNIRTDCESTLVQVHYLSLYDAVNAGQISTDILAEKRLCQESKTGCEFSGIDWSGKCVFGMSNINVLSTVMKVKTSCILSLPTTGWTLEDACTVPAAYATALYSLLVIGGIKRGQSILIHSGTGSVGQAAINTATYYGLTIFTTVGSQVQRDFIKKYFPQIKENHIGNFHDTSFQHMVLKQTNGEGVPLILNSLSEDMLNATVRCLAPGGKFLQIGKCHSLVLQKFKNGSNFHSFILDHFFDNDIKMMAIMKLLRDGITNGCIKPLSRTIFNRNEIKDAFHYLSSGEPIGNVIIKIRDNLNVKISAIPRYYCDPNGSYIITGGLGGIGLELADWLILKGARNLILTSRVGLKNGYQASRLRIWKSYCVNVIISTHNATTEHGCYELIKTANSLGPVIGIFHLAAQMESVLFENQTIDGIRTTLESKAVCMVYLDSVTRTLCPNLRTFLVFSSTGCGRGTAGITSYGMANSATERICEQRKKNGLPALAIQWAGIRQVGLVADKGDLAGMRSLHVATCFEFMEKLLLQDAPVVSAIVVAAKEIKSGDANEIVNSILNIMGFKNLKLVSMQSSLPELGMDSIMAVEIKTALDNFEVLLTAQQLRDLTFAKLQAIEQARRNL